MKNKNTVILLILLFVCGLSFIWLLRAFLLGNYPDFNTQYLVPKLVFQGVNPYVGAIGLFTPQVYPPTEFFFFIPFALLPHDISQYVYLLVSLVSLIGSLLLLAKIISFRLFSSANLILMTLVFVMFPTKFTLGMGQINNIVLFLLVLCLYFMKKEKETLLGIFLGITFLIKMFPIFLILYYVSSLNKKIILGGVLTALVGVLLCIIFIVPEINKSFFHLVPNLLSSWKLDYYNQSVSGFVGRSWGTDELASFLRTILTVVFIATSYGIVFWRKPHKFNEKSLIFGILITLTVLVNSFSWQHHYVWLVVPLYIIFSHIAQGKSRKIYFALFSLGYILIALNIPSPDLLPVLLQSHVFFGGVLFLILQLCLLVDRRRV